MTQLIEIQTVRSPVRGVVRPPGSKSLTNRALVAAALAEEPSILRGALASDDTRVMIDSLSRLGVSVIPGEAADVLRVAGGGVRALAVPSRPEGQVVDLWLGNSGTSIRFLTALCATGQGVYRLDGNDRMRERPIGDLVRSLNELGVEAVCERANDCPPVRVTARGLRGGTVRVSGTLSSQFLSGLLLAAPAAQSDLTLEVPGELVSRPYVDMTCALMRAFGVETAVQHSEGGLQFRVPRQTYRGRDYPIEPDASAASYFFAAAAVTGGTVTVEGLGALALQGDVGFVDVLERMGCEVVRGEHALTVTGRTLRGVDVDMNAISDTAQTLAAVAPFANGSTTIRNVAHMRHKETDRIHAAATELRRLGVAVEEFDDGLTIHPGPMRSATIETYDDHRMAMSFAVIGLRQPGVRIADPGCTSKTYPEFFADLDRLCEGSR
jgi:3-phosphoshikimate 1-carboxyvinyltransferase